MNFSDKQKHWCEFWLKNYTKLWQELTDTKRFTKATIKYLIIYEIRTRKRMVVIDRLLGRLYKIRRQEMSKVIELEIDNKLDGTTFAVALANEDEDFWKGGFPDEGESN